MPQLSVNRTLVKSPPELWSEFSEAERLANHLGEFGEITISRLDPEHTVAWESEHACGSVELEASGWGTKVTMNAEVRELEIEQASTPTPTVHQVIPDLAAWDRSAAEIESHAGWQTAAAQRAAERAAERAHRARKRGLARWLFRGRRAEREAVVVRRGPLPQPTLPEPPAPPHHRSGQMKASGSHAPEGLTRELTADLGPQPRARKPGPAAEKHEADTDGGAPAVDEERALAVLETALDNVGAAHHQPSSRASGIA